MSPPYEYFLTVSKEDGSPRSLMRSSLTDLERWIPHRSDWVSLNSELFGLVAVGFSSDTLLTQPVSRAEADHLMTVVPDLAEEFVVQIEA